MHTNNMKRQTMTSMSELIDSLKQKIRVLDALDRAWKVVPTDDN